MTRKSKTFTKVEKEKKQRIVKEYEVVQKEEKVEGTTCDFCGNWYADYEDTRFEELVRNPGVKIDLPDLMTLNMLMENITALEVHEFFDTKVKSEFAEDLNMIGQDLPELRETRYSSLYSLQSAIQQFHDKVGSPRGELNRPEIVDSAACLDPENLEEGDIVFRVDTEPEITGDTLHRCEHCVRVQNE